MNDEDSINLILAKNALEVTAAEYAYTHQEFEDGFPHFVLWRELYHHFANDLEAVAIHQAKTDGYILSYVVLLIIVGRYLNLLKNARYTCKEVAYHSAVFKQVHIIKRIFQFLKELEMKAH